MKIARVLAQTESDIKQLGYERLNLELALVKLSRLREDAIPLDQVLGKLEEIESKITAGIVKPTAVAAEPEPVYNEAAASTEVQEEADESDPLRAAWSKLLRAIKEKHPPALHAFLKEASPVSISDDSLTINFGPRFNWHREQVEEPENKEAIEAELSELMGDPMNLKISATDSSRGVEDSKQEVPMSQREMRRDAGQDESVRLVLDTFNGRIVEVKQ